MLRLRLLTLAATLAAIFAVTLSGCSWRGEGKSVASAIEATSQVKTRAFKGSMKFDMSQVKAGASGAAAPQSMTMTFDGAIDSRDPANPKMRINMVAEGSSNTVIAPGDGNVYLSAAGVSYSTPIPAERSQSSTIDPQKIYAALGEAVSGFAKSPPITNAEGKQVETVAAKVSRKKICGPVLESFGDALGKSAGLTGGLGGISAGRQGGSDVLQGVCRAMLKSDPRVWFGIDNGRLTDVELTATISVPFAGAMGIEVQYHEFAQDQEQTGFEPPAGARPLSSFDQLPGAVQQ